MGQAHAEWYNKQIGGSTLKVLEGEGHISPLFNYGVAILEKIAREAAPPGLGIPEKTVSEPASPTPTAANPPEPADPAGPHGVATIVDVESEPAAPPAAPPTESADPAE